MPSSASVSCEEGFPPMDRAELDDLSGSGILVQAETSDNIRKGSIL